MYEARFYQKTVTNQVQCLLCPHKCIIEEGKTGMCNVRHNREGKLYTHIYNKVAALHTDPIEKKPLYHFYPGKQVLSIGGIGCNFNCSFCQNHTISQCQVSDYNSFLETTPSHMVNKALATSEIIGVAYTYNEPFTFYEFLNDCAKEVHAAGLKNCIVSNGYILPEPLEKLIPHIDAFNIDLKAFNDNFYKKHTGGKLQPVLDTLKTIVSFGKHLEITNLIIPELNDNEKEFEKMVLWIANNLGIHIPLHLSRYFPGYKLDIAPTPVSKLESLYAIAKSHLNHVFLGNVSDEKRSNTYCPNCGIILIQRLRYSQKLISLSATGKCTTCGFKTKIIL